jgi:hypothetical protein
MIMSISSWGMNESHWEQSGSYWKGEANQHEVL